MHLRKESKNDPTFNATLVHIAQTHPVSDHKRDVFDLIAMSQFKVALTIIANPNAIVLDEGLVHNITAEHEYLYSFSNDEDFYKEIEELKSDFSRGFPNKYNELTHTQKNWLVKEGAACVLFNLGLLKAIYRADTPEEYDERRKQLQKKNYFNRPFYWGWFSNPTESDPELKRIVYDRREEIALKLAKEAATKSGNNLILLIYGARHQFGEKIKQMGDDDIIYAGRVMTTTEFRTPSVSAERMLPCGVAIRPVQQTISIDDFSRILQFYRTKYPSFSLFKGYRSDAIKALVTLLSSKEKTHSKNISYMTILECLAKTDTNRAELFRDGLLSAKIIFTATDKVILDLREAFDTASLSPTISAMAV